MDVGSYLSRYFRKYVPAAKLEKISATLEKELVTRTEFYNLQLRFDGLRDRLVRGETPGEPKPGASDGPRLGTPDSERKLRAERDQLQTQTDRLLEQNAAQLKWIQDQNQLIRAKIAEVSERDGVSDDEVELADTDAEQAAKMELDQLQESLMSAEAELLEANTISEEQHKVVLALQVKLRWLGAREGHQVKDIINVRLDREQAKLADSQHTIKRLEETRGSLARQIKVAEQKMLHVRRLQETKATADLAKLRLPDINKKWRGKKCGRCGNKLSMPVYCWTCKDIVGYHK